MAAVPPRLLPAPSPRCERVPETRGDRLRCCHKDCLKCCVSARVNEHVTVRVNARDAGCDKRSASASSAANPVRCFANVAAIECNILFVIGAHIG